MWYVWVTKELTSWAIHVGRRARADTTSSRSDGSSLERSIRIALPAFAGPSQASARDYVTGDSLREDHCANSCAASLKLLHQNPFGKGTIK